MRRAFKGRYGFLLLALLILVVVSPGMATDRLRMFSPLDAVVFTIMLAGLHAANPGRRSLYFGIGLTAVAIAVHCCAYWQSSDRLLLFHHALALSSLLYAQAKILSSVIANRRVTIETLKAAVCGYLLIGVAFVFAFAIAGTLLPDSFRAQSPDGGQSFARLTVRRDFAELMYLSFASLTTLGYADLIPVGAWAKTMCYVESIVGQFYATILIARLVGMHISRPVEPE